MAIFPLPSGNDYWVNIWGFDGTRWDGLAMVATSSIADAAWGTGLVTLVSLSTSNASATGMFTFTAPTALPAGFYYLTIHTINTLESAANALASMKFAWNGEAEVQELPAAAAGASGGISLVGSAMTLTSGERAALAGVIEADLIDDETHQAVMAAIVAKLAAGFPDLDTLTLAAIASQVRTELAVELARIDTTISSRHAAGAAVAKSPATLDWSADVINKPTIGTSTLTTDDILTAVGLADGNLDEQLAALPTDQDVRDAMKLAPTAGTPAVGSIDKQLVDIVTATSTLGTGARTVMLTVTDGTDPLEGARVRMTNGAESYVGDTDADGKITFNLDDLTWNVAVTKAMYSFTPTTIVVSADTVHTYTMTATSITASDPGFVTGYYYCYDETGGIEPSVTVQTRIKTYSGHGEALDATVRTIISDANGLAEITNMLPGATYQIRRGDDSDWADVTIPSTATSPYALLNILGADS